MSETLTTNIIGRILSIIGGDRQFTTRVGDPYVNVFVVTWQFYTYKYTSNAKLNKVIN